MPILDTEIVWRPSALVSDTTPAQNGGRMAFSLLTSGVKNNLFPDVSQAERTAGSVKWRKAFIHINSAQDTALLNVRVFLDSLTPAGDYVVIQPGTQTDTEDQITGRPYGIGTLYADVSAGATQIRVVCEHNADYATLHPFRVGDLLRVSDMPSIGQVFGREDWVTITNIFYGTDYATIDFTPALNYDYPATNTLISSVYQLPSVVGRVDNITVTSSSGILDYNTVGNLVAHNKGSIEENWTLTFTGATSFTASGATVGTVSTTGSTTANFAPTNPATGTPYFTIKATAWSGTWQSGDTVTFTTHPAAIPLWYRRRVPPGTSSLANDYASVAIHGESA